MMMTDTGAALSSKTDNLGDGWVLLAIATALFCVHLALNHNYGFHRDELAVLDDARSLAWGYVAYPPLTPFLGRIELNLFGTSLTGFRFFSALADCAAVLLTGLIAREFGARRGAQMVAALSVAFAPFALLGGSQFQYVMFDYLWWVVVAWAMARLINSHDPRWWVGIGAAIGVGMLTRYTMVFCLAGLFAGVLATPLRKQLATRWPWFGAGVALAICLPNLVWQFQHDFIYLDFVHSIHERDIRLGRTDGFFSQQWTEAASVFSLPLWVAGLWYFSISARGKPYRVFAWMYWVPLLLFALSQARAYYMAPAYPALLAAGAVMLQCAVDGAGRRMRFSLHTGNAILLLAAGSSSALIALPFARINSVGWNVSRAEHDNFAEQVGWPDFVAQVAQIYRALPPDERAGTAIYASNYGEAGAVDLYGPYFDLPKAIALTNSYWARGYGEPPPTTLIVLGASTESIAKVPGDCSDAGRVVNRFAVDNEESRGDPHIYLCRNLRLDWPAFWKSSRRFS